ncbi:hypothetical protein AN220_34540 [Streptomyces nanshensis]|nr:hypothetical protein AN220_34540 [Streptomyces nanshensis]
MTLEPVFHLASPRRRPCFRTIQATVSRLDLPDPVYWVTPRHLTGDDRGLTGRIGDTLSDLG